MSPETCRRLIEQARSVTFLWIVGLLALPSVRAADRPDVIVADFEGDTYGGWIAEGDAFGAGPARGRCPARWPSAGFSGAGWSTRSSGGDGSTGTLDLAAVRDRAALPQLLDRRGPVPGLRRAST